MKCIVAAAFLVLLSAVFFDCGSSAPSPGLYEQPEVDVFGAETAEEYTEDLGVRHRRVTCDLLSISTPIGSLGHSACAAHCLAMRRGYRGGRCRDGVCRCRSRDEIQLKGEEIDDPKAIVDGTNLTIIEDEGSISDEQTVDNLAHAQAILDADEEVQYQWKSGEGVTYRVVQVNPEEQEDPIGSNYSSSQGHIQPGAAVLTGGLTANHFYVIGNANEVFNAQSPRSLAPRANMQIDRNICVTNKPARVRRDERRRATHNEVERRRRDKINNWIAKLSKIIPDCSSMDNNKSVQSKGGILAKACEYIIELRRSDEQLSECLKEVERLNSHVEFLQQQNEKLKVHNALLRAELNQRGITPALTSDLDPRTGTSVSDS